MDSPSRSRCSRIRQEGSSSSSRYGVQCYTAFLIAAHSMAIMTLYMNVRFDQLDPNAMVRGIATPLFVALGAN
ncbi:uncharacterized protein BO88DRAFT_21638 [Aspergillus vadensis CBS 113365]|uniref:Uncharacterized protein n=1 Tax=Aspergillus vadensis (strain CBS 113365 / IMI 142717 / IBT 24658) TaxID=1448311 RepID=A0A319CHG8_ASPVC|nr:hypothetical protein BO88DRAFT_21638 [Aspergillus vadensis CBS 113365]PYH74758.1 hypothetical protein BO88DRAFT_21638 [Aspergillus vadensis CBS 113365]